MEHIVHEARETQVNKYAAYSRLALLAYDLILSSSREKDLIWDRHFGVSSLLYLFLRYPVIAFQVFNVCISYTSYSKVCPRTMIDGYHGLHCDALYRFTWAFSIIVTRVAISVSFMLRVYATMGLTRVGLIVTCLLGLVGACSIGLDVWQDIQVSCSTSSNPIATATVVTFFVLAAFDLITTCILIFQTIKIFCPRGSQAYKGEGLFSLIINHGLVYFIVVSTVQVVVIVLYYLPQGVYSLLLNNYTLLLSSVLLSRFLLDLREMHVSPKSTVSQEDETLTDVHFRHQSSNVERRFANSQVVSDFLIVSADGAPEFDFELSSKQFSRTAVDAA